MFGMGTGVTPCLYSPTRPCRRLRGGRTGLTSHEKRCGGTERVRFAHALNTRRGKPHGAPLKGIHGPPDAERHSVGMTKSLTVSTGLLSGFLRVHIRPINPVVFRGSHVLRQAILIFRGASRLDAFSGYPCRT